MSKGMFDSELILPGVITEIVNDYMAGYDTSEFGTTDAVTIIGTAFNGPVGVPVPVFSPEYAKYMFGEAFDARTRREATLVPEIYDAWERGCRTIYAVRVSGKDMFKDFELRKIDTDLRIRVNGQFPCNENKKCFMVFDRLAAAVRIYKPADRTTIQEKLQGVVNNVNSILVAEVDLITNGIHDGSRLVDLINAVNTLETNNVLTMAVVNKDGVVMTEADKDVQSLSVGDMFEGLYCIGRDNKADAKNIACNITVTKATDKDPYVGYSEAVYRDLTINNDVNQPFPLTIDPSISAEELKKVGFLDGITAANDIDYEEVELNPFDLYCRLGKGFVKNAKVENKGTVEKPRFRVVLPDERDEYRVTSIDDGIYSILENHKSDYLVLAGISAETVIDGDLPRIKDFKITKAEDIAIKLEGVDKLIARCDVAADAPVEEALKVNIAIEAIDPEADTIFDHAKIQEALEGMIELPLVAEAIENAPHALLKNNTISIEGVEAEIALGQYFLLTTANSANIYCVVNGDEALVENEEEVLVDQNFNLLLVDGGFALKPVVSFQDFMDGVLEDDFTVAVVEQIEDRVIVRIFSNELDILSAEEFINIINEKREIKQIMKFFLANGVSLVASLLPEERNDNIFKGNANDRKAAQEVDVNMYIPFTTDDNFARHLAQHCLYTQLKTYPTHGVIGCSKLAGINLSTIAQRVDDICNFNFDLYARKDNGNYMLDSNNEKYPLGRCVSITFLQYNVGTGSNYNYISNGAAGYAGMVSNLAIERSSTNQPININEMSFELSNFQLGRLNNKGIVCCKNTTNNGIVIVDGITQAPTTSAYRRLSTSKTINAVDKVLRNAIEPYIGLVDSLSTRNSMNTSIKSALDALKDVIISDFKFKIYTDSSGGNLGVIRIDYVIVPLNEIREVRNRVEISDAI